MTPRRGILALSVLVVALSVALTIFVLRARRLQREADKLAQVCHRAAIAMREDARNFRDPAARQEALQHFLESYPGHNMLDVTLCGGNEETLNRRKCDETTDRWECLAKMADDAAAAIGRNY